MSSNNPINTQNHRISGMATILALAASQPNNGSTSPTNKKVKQIRDQHLSSPPSPPKQFSKTALPQIKQPKSGY